MKETTYKQTEVGLIPSDWELKAIGDIFTFYSTSNFSKAEMAIDGEVGCVHYGLIHAIDNTSFSLRNGVKFYVTKEQAKYEALQNGDVVMVDASEDLVGLNKSVEVSGITNKEFIAGLHTFHLRDKNSIYINSFRGLVLNSYSVKKQMLRVAVGMKVFGVSKPQLQQILVPVPVKSEQTAIATALSDADALISSLEKLIAKKRMIKQGAMQQLLQPKEGWEVKKLGEVCEVFKGKGISKSQISESGKYECILYGELFTTYKEVITSIVSKTNTNESVHSKIGDILYPGSTTTTGIDLAKASTILKDDVLLGGDIIILRKSNFNYNSVFLSYFLNEIKRYDIAQTTKGITIHHLYGTDLAGINVEFPSIEEQNRIATILSDIDAEIATLETKLEKYRKVKLGMMQNLLTGKIRLI